MAARLIGVVAALTLGVAAAGNAGTARPCANGAIAFSSNTGENSTAQYFVIDRDGRHRLDVTHNPYANSGGVLSPDGKHVAFREYFEPSRSVIAVADVDGRHERLLTDPKRVWAETPAWSPDGESIAYQQPGVGIHVLRLDGSEDRFLAGLDGPVAWAPDGQRLTAYTVSRTAVVVVGLDGSISAELPLGSNFAWSPDGSTLAYGIDASGSGWVVHLIRADGTDDRVVGPGAQAVWSPDGRRLAVMRDFNGPTSLVVEDADGTNPVTIARDVASGTPSWSPDGTTIAWVHDGRDVFVTKLLGRVTRRVTHEPDGSIVNGTAWSRDGGRILYQAEYNQADNELYVVSENGRGLRGLTRNNVFDGEPAWSPDGTRIAFIRGGPDRGPGGDSSELWVMDSSGRHARQLTAGWLDGTPAWAPDGHHIAFTRGDDSPSIYVIRDDGTHGRMIVRNGSDPTWSPDGRRIAYAYLDEIRIRSSDGRRRLLVESSRVDDAADLVWSDRLRDPVWSPDGRTIAFVAHGGLDPKMDFDFSFTIRSDGTRLTYRYGEADPDSLSIGWSPDGKQLLYGDGGIRRLPIAQDRLLVVAPGLGLTTSDPAWQPRCGAH